MEPKKFPETIQTERLTLKRHARERAEVIFSYIDEDRERMREFLPWVDGTKRIEDTQAYLETTIQEWESHQAFDYGMFRTADDTYLGNAGVHTISWENERCEIGYWINGKFEGQGYVTEAVRGIELAAFDVGFHRVEIRCSSRNERSASIPVRLGYRLDGTLREDSIELGQFRDTFVYSKLKTER